MKKLSVLQSQMLPLSSLRANTGQVPGLPANPRKISKQRLSQLKESIKNNPEMLSLREILVYPYQDEYIVIGGNQRLTALAGLHVTDIPCKVIPSETSVEQLRAYLIKDNIEFGEWVNEMLSIDWDMSELDDFGMEDVARIQCNDDVLSHQTMEHEQKIVEHEQKDVHAVDSAEKMSVCSVSAEQEDASESQNEIPRNSTDTEVTDTEVTDTEKATPQSSTREAQIQKYEEDIDKYFQKISMDNITKKSVLIMVKVPASQYENVEKIREAVTECVSSFEGVVVS